jgi:hypothetical protein
VRRSSRSSRASSWRSPRFLGSMRRF